MRKVTGSILLGLCALASSVCPVGAQTYAGGASGTSMAGFGGSMAVVDGQVMVGEPANVMRPGIVYVYGRAGSGEWSELQQLQAPAAQLGDGFGIALAGSGSTLLVASRAGVHAFARDAAGAWSAAGDLVPPAPLGEEAGFGAALAVDGDVALVGAPGADQEAGAVFIYRRSASGWTMDGRLSAPDVAAGDYFGAALALDGSGALVGAPLHASQAGAVYAYERANGAFAPAGMLEAGAVTQGDRFGVALALQDGMALVGAPAYARATGAVFSFVRRDGQWMATGQLAAFDGGPRSGFGSAVTVSGSEIWVGSPRNNAAYVFTPARDGMGVATVRKITTSALSASSGMGATLASGGTLLAAGATREDFGAGSVVIFERGADGSWSESGVVESAPEGFDAVAGGEVDCDGGEASQWQCSEVDLVSFMPVSELAGEEGARGLRTNDNWGWKDPDTGKLYALVGLTDRAAFVDVTDPENPSLVGILPMTEGANGSAWRDIKTYDNHAFIVSDGAGQHGMQVFDLTRLRNHSGAPTTFEPDALYTRVASVHNIVINEDTGFAYAVGASSGGETCGGGLHIINIQDPENPTFAGCFADPQTGRASTGYTHDAQCVTYHGPDADYQGREICFGANETALSIADVSDKANTVAISRAAYPNVGYSHQGWLTADQRYFYLDDELDELQGKVDHTRTLIWDVSDLDDPQLVAEHMGTQPSSDHNLYIVGNLMYQSNYQSGLRILDISEPTSPVEVAYFDTVPYGDNGPGFGGSWSNYPFFDNGVVIVTSGNEGLFLLRPNVRSTVF